MEVCAQGNDDVRYVRYVRYARETLRAPSPVILKNPNAARASVGISGIDLS